MTGWLVAAVPELAAWAEDHGDDLETRLRSRWDEARGAWPALAVSAEQWVAAVARGLDASTPLSALDSLHAADLYLAQACAAGDNGAIAAFEAACRVAIETSLRSMNLADDAIAEVTQDVREKLFVPADGAPKIATYSGRAALTTWTRTVATRTALARFRRRTDVAVDDAVMQALPAVTDGPEEEHFRSRYAGELKAAFEEAMVQLSYEQRNILRHHYIDQLTIDEIGALYNVHRTTAFRWLEAARATLGKRTQNAFRARVQLTTSEMQSVVRLLESNVELSLRRLLAI